MVSKDEEKTNDRLTSRERSRSRRREPPTTLTASQRGPSFSSVPGEDEAKEDEIEPWVGHTVRATHKADDFMTATETEHSMLETGRKDSQTPRRPLDKAHYKVEPSDVDQEARVLEMWTTTISQTT